MKPEITTELLAGRVEALPVLAQWFKTEWPAWYGPGGPGDAEQDLLTYANQGSLPVGVVVLYGGELCGVGALKAQSIPSHSHLAPWAAACFVVPRLRGRGIGAVLLSALECEAKSLGYSCIYCATGTAESLLKRGQWSFLEAVTLDGKTVSIYEKALDLLLPS
ncbi:MAG: GNAT family N-acetyltransferase [Burkholderiaceae bacterium]|nr:GNAT family N-acetyltransferase [Burkholderiaceae bacterium]